MILQKVRDLNNNIMITPVNKENLPIFIHCTNGYSEFPNKMFHKKLRPILEAHGYMFIEIKGIKGE